MRRGSLSVVAAVLLALLAQPASANPFVPPSCPPDPDPVVVSYDPITPLGDHLADFSWTISIRYCGGDPVNRSDPMGTRILVAKGSMEAFNQWCTDHLSPGFKKVRFDSVFPQNSEGAYREWHWRPGLFGVTEPFWDIVSKFDELKYSGTEFDATKLNTADKAFIQAYLSDEVYIFEKGKGFRKKTGNGEGSWVCTWDIAITSTLDSGANWIGEKEANALAFVGEVSEPLIALQPMFDSMSHTGLPAADAPGRIGVLATGGLSKLRALRVVERGSEVAQRLTATLGRWHADETGTLDLAFGLRKGDIGAFRKAFGLAAR